MRSDDIAISVRSVTKRYRLFSHPGDRIKQFFSFGAKQYHREFTALQDVSFDIKRGEAVGVIGRNGSGKSTLLQLICGILKPTSGIAEIRGRVSALLELGAGFNPEFTGRENVYFQGSLIGLGRRVIDDRIDAIIGFADIGDFVDQPVRTYSSGMFVRLAFSVAIHTEPDILVVDEALSVGDIGFQQRCFERIHELKKQGVTIIVVSHDLMLSRTVTDRLMYLDLGQIKAIGEPESVGEVYIRDMQDRELAGQPPAVVNRQDGNRILSVEVQHNSSVRIVVHAQLTSDVSDPEIVVQIRDRRGYIFYGSHAQGDDIEKGQSDRVRSLISATLQFEPHLLMGEFGVTVSLNELGRQKKATVLDKRVGIASLSVPILHNQGIHGCVNLNAKWLAARDQP